jgi:hypothetical protein
MACRLVARQRPRNRQLYNGRSWAAARKEQQRNDVFCAVLAEILKAKQVRMLLEAPPGN